MNLATLLQPIYPIDHVDDAVNRNISHLVLDSREAKADSLFFALKGTQVDGRQFIPLAIKNGAAAILVDADQSHTKITFQDNIPIIPIHQLQSNIGIIAARFYGNPAKRLRMIGVTGTSGKTSCTQFIAQSLQELQVSCGVIGTLGSGFYGELGAAGLTTPDAIHLQMLLKNFVEQGAQAIAMEVSSHSIDQHRIGGIEFDIGIFTNLSQDHLDYHGDMETYAAVKYRFLESPLTKQLIINADDERGLQWLAQLPTQKNIIAYSTKPIAPLPSHISNVYTRDAKFTAHGITATVLTPWGQGKLCIPLIGQFNLSNALAVLATLCAYGFPLPLVLEQLGKLSSVPGRMQILGGDEKPLVVVDYAHKPDALEKVLQALRVHTQGKLICVFGCGGERDRSKRPIMAKIAETFADKVIVTNDNPRHENPADIVAEILQGFSYPERVSVELDRSKAINNSIQCATVGDCILVAGKGAERYQQIGDTKLPFDDVTHVQACLL